MVELLPQSDGVLTGLCHPGQTMHSDLGLLQLKEFLRVGAITCLWSTRQGGLSLWPGRYLCGTEKDLMQGTYMSGGPRSGCLLPLAHCCRGT